MDETDLRPVAYIKSYKCMKIRGNYICFQPFISMLGHITGSKTNSIKLKDPPTSPFHDCTSITTTLNKSLVLSQEAPVCSIQCLETTDPFLPTLMYTERLEPLDIDRHVSCLDWSLSFSSKSHIIKFLRHQLPTK